MSADELVKKALESFSEFSRVLLEALALPGAEIRFVFTLSHAEAQVWLGGTCLATTELDR